MQFPHTQAINEDQCKYVWIHHSARHTCPRAKPARSREQSLLKERADTAPYWAPTAVLPRHHFNTSFPSETWNHFFLTVKPVLSSHTREAQKVAAKGRSLLTGGKYQYKIKVWEHSVWLQQVGCLIEVTATTGLTVMWILSWTINCVGFFVKERGWPYSRASLTPLKYLILICKVQHSLYYTVNTVNYFIESINFHGYLILDH